MIEGGSFYEIDNGAFSQIPSYDIYYTSPSPAAIQPLIDWGIVTEPQSVCDGPETWLACYILLANLRLAQQLNGRKLHYPQGKCLGGR